MKVAVLQQYLRSLAAPLQAAGATPKVTNDLEQTCQALEPFKEEDFGQFAAFLARADELHRTGVLPMLKSKSRKGPGASKNLNEAQIQHMAQQLLRLSERAAGHGAGREGLVPELDQLGLENMTKAEAVAVARAVGVRTTTRMSQPEAVQELRRLVLEGTAAPQTDSAASEPRDAGRIRHLAQQVRQLEEKAAGADVSLEELAAGLDHLHLNTLNEADVRAVAQEIGLRTEPGASTADAVRLIRRSVLDRKEALETARV